MARRISDETDHPQSHLVERLRRAGLRATRPRLIILDVLERGSGHRSIDELLDLLRARGVRLPRATVYNVIRSLVAHGLVMVADTGPGRMLVEPAQSWHHHFVCRQCGAVLDVACVVGAKPCLHGSRHRAWTHARGASAELASPFCLSRMRCCARRRLCRRSEAVPPTRSSRCRGRRGTGDLAWTLSTLRGEVTAGRGPA